MGCGVGHSLGSRGWWAGPPSSPQPPLCKVFSVCLSPSLASLAGQGVGAGHGDVRPLWAGVRCPACLCLSYVPLSLACSLGHLAGRNFIYRKGPWTPVWPCTSGGPSRSAQVWPSHLVQRGPQQVPSGPLGLAGGRAGLSRVAEQDLGPGLAQSCCPMGLLSAD